MMFNLGEKMKEECISAYHKLDSPIMYILKYTIFYSILLIVLSLASGYLTLNIHILDKYVFVVYLAGYIGMWHTYFASKKSADPKVEKNRLKIQSLRRLLGLTSKQWSSHSEGEDSQSNYFEKKSETSMAVIAILIATSIFVFNQFSNIFLDNKQEVFTDNIVIYLGMTSSFVAFTALMLSVDSLDTVFNKFQDEDTQKKLVNYFYSYVANPRYMATSFMFFSLILLVAYHSVTMASICTFIVIFIGYDFWFPNLESGKRFRLLALCSFISLPIIVKMVI